MTSQFERRGLLSKRFTFEAIDKNYLDRLIDFALEEDLNFGGLNMESPFQQDMTVAGLSFTGNAQADCITSQTIIVCGLPLVQQIADKFQISFKTPLKEGALVQKGEHVGTFIGDPATLLTIERFTLNFLLRLSGIATHTHQFVQALEGQDIRLLDTRKTTPGWRVLEKYAVGVGGGWNHRYGLSDRIMLKDNHWVAQNINSQSDLALCIERLRQSCSEIPIQIEVDTLEMFEWALAMNPDVILLDNFSIESIQHAISIRHAKNKTVLLEASGTMTQALVNRLKDLELDFISIGAMIHQACWVNMGMNWKTEDLSFS